MRTILHIDANAFYCACHAARDPSLRDQPICVGGRKLEDSSRVPIIVTASYEARAINKNIKAGMTVPEAQRLVPGLLVIEPNFDLYRRYSQAMFTIIREFTPLVEPISIDEAFADVTGCLRPFHSDAKTLAHALKEVMKKRLGITVSVGISTNKLLAKQASDLRKPDIVTTLYSHEVQAVLWPLPVGELYGCGKKSAAALQRLGIQTIGELAGADTERLRRSFGNSAVVYLKRASAGIDDSLVNPTSIRDVKSIGNSTTLPNDTRDRASLHRALLALCDQVGRRLRHSGYIGRTITVTVRDRFRKDIQRSRTLSHSIDFTEDIYKEVCALFKRHWNGELVRLLGVSISRLCKRPLSDDFYRARMEQLDLFDQTTTDTAPTREDLQRKRSLTLTLDSLRDRFGEQIILPARLIGEGAGAELLDKKSRGTSLEKDHLRLTD